MSRQPGEERRNARMAPEFGSERAATDWLARRGGPEDLGAEKLVAPISLLVTKRVASSEALGGLGATLAVIPAIIRDHRAWRRHKTNRRRLGLWLVDGLALDARTNMLHPTLLRLPVGLTAAAITLGLEGTGQRQLFAAVMIFAAVNLLTIRNFRWAAGPAVAALIASPGLWWLDALAVYAAFLVLGSWDLWQMMGNPWWVRGPAFAFVPVRTRMRLRVHRQWSSFVTAVDLASHGRADSAASFVAAIRKRPVPAVCEPVLLMVRALRQLHAEDRAGALLTAREAAEAARSAPDPLRGWCLAELSRVLAANGEGDRAATVSADAARLLSGRRGRTHRRRLLIEELDRGMGEKPLHKALRDVHTMRRTALRSADQWLTLTTELWLAQLLLRAGNEEGARYSLRGAHLDDARSDFLVTPDEAARVRLLSATVLVDREETRDAGRRDALAALAQVDARTRPLAAAAARQVLALADERDGHERAALAQAVQALLAVHETRYQVGTAQGRKLWEHMQLSAYGTALRLSSRQGSGTSAVVAEIVETARGEVLPRRMDDTELARHRALWEAVSAAQLRGTGGSDKSGKAETGSNSRSDADRGDNAGRPGRAALAEIGLSPVRRPPSITVAGSRRLPAGAVSGGGARGADAEKADFDLDRALVAVAGRCWYWSAVTVQDRYYWTVRTPSGEWSHGWRPLGPGTEAALADTELRDALPLPQADEAPEALRRRVTNGALSAPASDGRELALLRRVSAAFLPEPLAEGLASHTGTTASVVVALPAALSHVPVAALPLTAERDVRVVDVARVIHVPAWAVIGQCLARPAGRLGASGELKLAVLRPDAAESDTTGAVNEASGPEQAEAGVRSAAKEKLVLRPPGPARRVLRGPVTKEELTQALRQLDALDERDGLLYLLGHVGVVPGNPYLSGLRVAPTPGDGTEPGGTAMLSMADMLGSPDAGSGTANEAGVSCPVPRKVLAVGCASLGLELSPSGTGADRVHTPVSEWLGLGSALLLAGADHVICTVYPVLHPSDQLEAAARLLTRRLCAGTTPPDALREMQLAHLKRWRGGGGGRPFVWQAFAYTGLGG
ncbi:CHAT domain-containing protein [Streptomyces sp. ADMS]|uniref:CHAT domain-containing protein n=1 Tax=Streptomyces sp. ADMS TaxID=3071415 RepID=UPI00296FAA36|nr:CHAT domain-containing protein [Streptomyces sp. ADMS]MDW4910772.1 CHAT domain-containing protein [Streptomyces sp. ADMS]